MENVTRKTNSLGSLNKLANVVKKATARGSKQKQQAGSSDAGPPTYSRIGEKFVTFYTNKFRTPYHQGRIPTVEVAVSILRLNSIDTVAHTFDCELELTTSWMDPSVPRLSHHDFTYEDHFVPVIDILNVAHGTKPIPIPYRQEPRVLAVNVGLGGKEVRVGVAQRYQCRLMSKMYTGHFPDDVQILEIHLQAREVRPWPQGGKWEATSQLARVILQDPREYIPDGHSIARSADWLPQWRIEKLYGRPATHKLNPLDPVATAKLLRKQQKKLEKEKKKEQKRSKKKGKKGEPPRDGMSLKAATSLVGSKVRSVQKMQAFASLSRTATAEGPNEDGVLADGKYRSLPESVSSYTVQVTVSRRRQPTSLLPLMLVSILAFTVYFVPVLLVAERLTLVLLLMICILAIRVLEVLERPSGSGGRSDPHVAKLTRFCMKMLFVQGVFVAVISQMEQYMCQEPDVNYWTLNYDIPWVSNGTSSSSSTPIVNTTFLPRRQLDEETTTITTPTASVTSSIATTPLNIPEYVLREVLLKLQATQEKDFEWCFITAWLDRVFAILHLVIVLLTYPCSYKRNNSASKRQLKRRGHAALETEGLLNVDAFHRFHEHPGGANNKKAQKKRAGYPLQSFPDPLMRCVYESHVMKISGGIEHDKKKAKAEAKAKAKAKAKADNNASSPKKGKAGQVVPEAPPTDSEMANAKDSAMVSPLDTSPGIETKSSVKDMQETPKSNRKTEKTPNSNRGEQKLRKSTSKRTSSRKPVVEASASRVEV